MKNKILLSGESSARLDMLRFPLIVAVVFIHNYDSNIITQGGVIGMSQTDGVVEFIRKLISKEIARIAVPLFFVMSSYLFFLNFELSKSGYLNKLRTRVSTLLVPLVFWNVVTLLVIAVAQAIPSTSSYFSGRHAQISSFSAVDYFSSILGIGRVPISYQFWFVRDLFVLALVSPIIFVLCRKVPYLVLPFVLIMWFADPYPSCTPSAEAILFFSIGCWLAVSKINLFAIDDKGLSVAILYLFLALTSTALHGTELGGMVHKASIFLGVISGLWLTKFAFKSAVIKQRLVQLGGVSFFVYAAHEPLLTVVKKITFKTLEPQSQYLILFLYFFIPIVVVLFILIVKPLLQSAFPRLMNMATGGRQQ